MGTGSFPGVKRPGCDVYHPLPHSAEVKERVELYLHSPSGPSWTFLGWTLPFIIVACCDRKYTFLSLAFTETSTHRYALLQVSVLSKCTWFRPIFCGVYVNSLCCRHVSSTQAWRIQNNEWVNSMRCCCWGRERCSVQPAVTMHGGGGFVGLGAVSPANCRTLHWRCLDH